MPDDALSCLKCEKPLKNAFPHDVENQPSDGVACTTHGNYGSRVFDPMDGEYLEFNICDECLIAAGEKSLILTGRDYRHVRVEGMIWGAERINRPYVKWNKDLEPWEESLDLDITEVEALADTERIRWNAGDKETLLIWVAQKKKDLGLE